MFRLALIGATMTVALGLYYYFRPPQLTPISLDNLRNINRIQNQRGDIADFEQV